MQQTKKKQKNKCLFSRQLIWKPGNFPCNLISIRSCCHFLQQSIGRVTLLLEEPIYVNRLEIMWRKILISASVQTNTEFFVLFASKSRVGDTLFTVKRISSRILENEFDFKDIIGSLTKGFQKRNLWWEFFSNFDDFSMHASCTEKVWTLVNLNDYPAILTTPR